MSARQIKGLRFEASGSCPETIVIGALQSAGYRILAPGELDAETVETCVQNAHNLANLYRRSGYECKFYEDKTVFRERAFGAENAAKDIRALLRSLDTEG